MKLADNKANLSFSNGSPSVELPVYQGSIGPDVIDIRKLYAQRACSPMTRASCPRPQPSPPSPTSMATRASCCTAATPSSSWPNCDFLETCHLLL